LQAAGRIRYTGWMPPHPPRVATWKAAIARPGPPLALAVALAAGWVLFGLDAPLVEDSLFWWVPKGLLAAQGGPARVLAGALPDAMTAGLTPETTPPQWRGGLPDYAHPPLWYAWLGLFLGQSASVHAVHLACLLPAVVAAAGFVKLGERLGNPWAGLAVLCLPPVVAQAWRPELDLPLLAAVPWALVALVDGRWRSFALLSALAVWCKEPGVLLAAPAVWRAARERRLRWEALAPLAALGLWGLLHPEGLAKPERLPADLASWLTRDLPLAFRLALVEQGRWVLLLGAPLALWGKDRSLPHQLLAVFALTWVVFFSVVGFSTGRSPGFVLTHVRYFVPGIAVMVLLVGSRWPWLALPGLLWMHDRSPYGPEGSLWGIDVGRAEVAAAPWIEAAARQGVVWVGSYQAAGLTQPWAGRTPRPVLGFRVYSADTRPAALALGSTVLIADYGEPAGRLERGLSLEPVERWTVGEASVVAYTVAAVREVAAPVEVEGPGTPPR